MKDLTPNLSDDAKTTNPNWDNLADHPPEWADAITKDHLRRRREKQPKGGNGREEGRRTPKLHSLDPEAVEKRRWLWRNYLPIGKFVGVEGSGDVGKTFVFCDLASRIVRGDTMPDGSQGTEGCVLWLTDEEGGEEETRRLLAAGLNRNLDHFGRIATFSTDTEGRPLELPRDLPLVREAVATLEQRSGLPVVLIFIDPLFQFLEGNVDENKAKDVRRACAPLNPLARELDCCILGLRHWNKATKQARRDRGAGSAQFSSTFRIQLSIFKHPTDSEIRVLANDMNRYSAESDRPPLGFQLVPVPHLETARVQWKGAVELPEQAEGPGPLVAQVRDFLRETVGNGEERALPSKELQQAAQKATRRHFSDETFRQAARAAGLEKLKKGAVWFWYRPLPS